MWLEIVAGVSHEVSLLRDNFLQKKILDHLLYCMQYTCISLETQGLKKMFLKN